MVWVNGVCTILSRMILLSRKDGGVGVWLGCPRPPQVNRLAHGLGDRDKAVIAASVAVFALDFLALQPATPRCVHDSEHIAVVASPSQAEELTRSESAETCN